MRVSEAPFFPSGPVADHRREEKLFRASLIVHGFTGMEEKLLRASLEWSLRPVRKFFRRWDFMTVGMRQVDHARSAILKKSSKLLRKEIEKVRV